MLHLSISLSLLHFTLFLVISTHVHFTIKGAVGFVHSDVSGVRRLASHCAIWM